MAETNTKLIRILQVVGILFLLGAGFLALTNLILPIDFDQSASILLLSSLLICGLCFGMTGLMSENPERTRRSLIEWFIVVAAILIWVVGVYALLP
ncbi:MAG: hypothetical protein ACXADB_01865 [Candidatus Hermodarchaeia archaeon]